MRKLLLCLAIAATCLIPSPKSTAAAAPPECGGYCCHPGPRPPATACVDGGAVITCDAWWTATHAYCR